VPFVMESKGRGGEETSNRPGRVGTRFQANLEIKILRRIGGRKLGAVKCGGKTNKEKKIREKKKKDDNGGTPLKLFVNESWEK